MPVRKQIDENGKVFGRRLKLGLDLTGKSASELARHVDATPQAVHLWLKETAEPLCGKVARIAEFLDCSTDWLYGRADARGPGQDGDTFITAQGRQDPIFSELQLMKTEIQQLRQSVTDLGFTSGGRLSRPMAANAF